MRNLFVGFLLLLSAGTHVQPGSYLFVWAGDDNRQSSDFLAVLDADPASARYGEIVASAAVPGPSGTPHHTEGEMSQDGFLLANAFESGRSMLFDLREPQHPALVTSFGDLGGYMHPHTYVRLSNGPNFASGKFPATCCTSISITRTSTAASPLIANASRISSKWSATWTPRGSRSCLLLMCTSHNSLPTSHMTKACSTTIL